MNEVILDLEPKKIWFYFKEILEIPRPSKKEDKIKAYLIDFGKKHNLETLTDEVGNVLIRKAATPGMENRKSVVLQSHMDMVCEKNSDTNHDFDNDPIEVYIEDGWVTAKGTTLGGDDGIGVAAALAILASDDIEHGPLEALFTVDEETGLTGAFGLKPGFLKSNILLNLDSEDEGQLFIGCAGGQDTLVWLPYDKVETPDGFAAFKLKVFGLKGGHSGDDIVPGRPGSRPQDRCHPSSGAGRLDTLAHMSRPSPAAILQQQCSLRIRPWRICMCRFSSETMDGRVIFSIFTGLIFPLAGTRKS